jgi:hypothetical protein
MPDYQNVTDDQQAAAAHGITLSEVVRRALRDHLKTV